MQIPITRTTSKAALNGITPFAHPNGARHDARLAQSIQLRHLNQD